MIPAFAPGLIEAHRPRSAAPPPRHLVMELPASDNGALCRPPASRPWVPSEGYSASLTAHGVALSPLSPFVAVDGCVAPLISRPSDVDQRSAGSPEAPAAPPGLPGRARSARGNPPHLGELIRESMDDVGWSVPETALRLRCERGNLSRLLNDRAGVSANMALTDRG